MELSYGEKLATIAAAKLSKRDAWIAYGTLHGSRGDSSGAGSSSEGEVSESAETQL